MSHIYTHTLANTPVRTYVLKNDEFSEDTMTTAHCLVRQWLWGNSAIGTDKWGAWCTMHNGNSPIIYHIDRKIAANLPRLGRRINSLMRKEIDLSLPDELAAKIGELASKDTLPERLADSTHAFTWRGGDFGDSNACFFRQGEYKHCRVNTLPSLNAAAIRLYRDETRGMARCWAIPIPDGHELFDADNFQFCITNYYSESDKVFREVARLMAEAQTGTPYTYYKLDDLDIDGFYTNSNAIYLLRPTDMDTEVPDYVGISRYFVEQGEDSRPQWAVDDDYSYKCCSCGARMDENEGYHEEDGDWCDDCYCNHYGTCDMCEETYPNDNLTGVGDYSFCESCLDNYTVRCDHCGDHIITSKGRYSNLHVDDFVMTEDDHTLCENCASNHALSCESCSCTFYDEETTGEVIDGDWYCDDCAHDWHSEHDGEESEEGIEVTTCARPLDDGDMAGAMQYQLELV